MPATVQGSLLGGTHAARPAATDPPIGATYSCTDHNVEYQTDGSIWSTRSTFGTAGAYSPGGTDVAVADGGTGASTASGARTNLGISAANTPITDAGAYYAGTDVEAALQEIGAGGIGGGGGSGSGSLVLLEQHDASSSATLDFTSFISSTFDEYLFEFINVVPATNGVSLYMRMGTGAGPTYDAGANYASTDYRWVPGGAAQSGASSGGNQIVLTNYNATDTILNTANYGGVNGSCRLMAPGSSIYKHVTAQTSWFNTGSVVEGTVIHGAYLSTTAVTAVRFLMSSGNIASGTIRVYGIAKAPVALPAGALVLLESHTASASASLDFVTRNAAGLSGATIQSDFDEYVFDLINILPATASAILSMRMSTDGGATFDSGANYSVDQVVWRAGGSAVGGGAGGSRIDLVYSTGIGNSGTGASMPTCGRCMLYAPEAALFKQIVSDLTYYSGDGFRVRVSSRGAYESTTAVNAIRFLMSSGNITSGAIRCYGVAK